MSDNGRRDYGPKFILDPGGRYTEVATKLLWVFKYQMMNGHEKKYKK